MTTNWCEKPAKHDVPEETPFSVPVGPEPLTDPDLDPEPVEVPEELVPA